MRRSTVQMLVDLVPIDIASMNGAKTTLTAMMIAIVDITTTAIVAVIRGMIATMGRIGPARIGAAG